MIKKIIFIDLDGTALDKKIEKGIFNNFNAMSIKNISSIKNLPDNYEVIISTGRANNKKLKRIVKSIGSKNYIFWNGAGIVIDDILVKNLVIEKSKAKQIIDYAKEHDLNIIINSDMDKIYVKSSWFRFLIKFFTYKKTYSYKSMAINSDINKIMFFSINKNKIKKAVEYINNNFKDIIALNTHKNYMEVTHIDAQKGYAELYMCEQLGVNPSHSFHIGDSMNDSTTKNKIGKLIVMYNASKSVKALADVVAPYSFKSGGLSKVIEDIKHNKI
ncbi:HAD hydrolase family protein [Mycoplasma phocimorsus]|uniref:HAD hydrolase family protein n=1 Tax=Mycoplasma phocimorsus TaxID=3045839 RepID=UPI0024C012B6|nr:HAD hydrolase family protein [Mycoplasma phocimorsus]MDJ1646395.1 HAD hydrolase family protein [Mycoplasma phocimorsus]MDJ1647046.1 HAD hydrolase family protein [Mycoplasma phocimorsus]MDJ1647487.1 HAD hydrolase family protein [Mycoplasma phocimorsus]MDJ1647974.1 HAD hydrolase family protein [Mycoplasma phocimorsus]MDJ1649097.1 HAD hydrolase family protein [Mycoplasma phocimorsus]